MKSIEGITSIQYSKYQDFISATAPVSVWESIFETVFFTVSRKVKKMGKNSNIGKVMAVRSLQYKLPKLLRGHVCTVLNTVQAPVFKKSKEMLNTEKPIDSDMLSNINNDIKNIVSKKDDKVDATIKDDNSNNNHSNSNNNSVNNDNNLVASNKKAKCRNKKDKKTDKKNPSKNSVRLGLTYPNLLNEIYNIQNNDGKICYTDI